MEGISNLIEGFDPLSENYDNIEGFTITPASQTTVPFRQPAITQTNVQPSLRTNGSVPFRQTDSPQNLNTQFSTQRNRTRSNTTQYRRLNRPSNARPSTLNESPVRPPGNVNRRDWRRWWRRNRQYFGDRDYYIDLGYPIWWIDYYYPLYDSDYDNDYYYDYPISDPVTIIYPATTTSPVITTDYPLNTTYPVYPATSTSALATDNGVTDGYIDDQVPVDPQIANQNQEASIDIQADITTPAMMFTPIISGLCICCLIILLIIALLR